MIDRANEQTIEIDKEKLLEELSNDPKMREAVLDLATEMAKLYVLLRRGGNAMAPAKDLIEKLKERLPDADDKLIEALAYLSVAGTIAEVGGGGDD